MRSLALLAATVALAICLAEAHLDPSNLNNDESTSDEYIENGVGSEMEESAKRLERLKLYRKYLNEKMRHTPCTSCVEDNDQLYNSQEDNYPNNEPMLDDSINTLS